MPSISSTLKRLDGRAFVHAGRNYVLRGGLPVPVDADRVEAAPGVSWVSLPDATRLCGRPRASISSAIKKRHLRAAHLDSQIVGVPVVFVCYEDLLAWTRALPVNPRQRSRSAEMEGCVGVTPEACIKYLQRKRQKKLAKKKQKQRARQRKKANDRQP